MEVAIIILDPCNFVRVVMLLLSSVFWGYDDDERRRIRSVARPSRKHFCAYCNCSSSEIENGMISYSL